MHNRSRLLVTLGIIATFILSACGVKDIQTTTVDENFKGTRVIEMRLAKKDLKDKLNGTIEQVDQVIKDNLPAGLTFSGITELDAETHKATFTLTFDSVEDYKAKINAIVATEHQLNGDNFRFAYAKDSFRKPVVFEEDLKIKHLFSWIPTALVNAGLVKDSDKDHIFDNSLEKPKLVIDSNTYESDFGSEYEIDEAGPGVKGVTVWVALDSLSKLKAAKVIFTASESKSAVLDDLTKFIEANQEIKGKFAEANVKSGIISKPLVLEVKDFKELNSSLAAIFGKDKAELNVDAKDNTIKGKLDPVAVCENYCSDRFIINTSDIYDLKSGAIAVIYKDEEDGHNWDVEDPESFDIKVKTNVVIDSVDVTLDLAANGGVTITRDFMFPKALGDVKVLDEFKKLLTPKGSKAKINVTTEDKFFKVTSVHEGDLETMNDVFTPREEMRLDVDYIAGRYMVDFGPGLAGHDDFPEIKEDVKIQVNKPFMGTFEALKGGFNKFKSDGSLVVPGNEARFTSTYSFHFNYGPIKGIIIGVVIVILLLVAGLILFLKRKTLFAKKPAPAPVPVTTPAMPGVMPVAPAIGQTQAEPTTTTETPVVEAETATQVTPEPAERTSAEQSGWAEDELI